MPDTDTEPTTELRKADLAQLASLLRVQQDTKLDAVVPAQAITSRDGVLHIAGTGPDGPAGPAGVFSPTTVADEHLADKLRIPLPYLRRMHAERPDLYDANLNGWLRGTIITDSDNPGDMEPMAPPDGRKFLARCFTNPDNLGGQGVLRALLSDGYKRMDNLDTLTAALQGAREADTQVEVESCDLTERRMVVRLVAPQVRLLAPQLLANYRSPFSGQRGADLPVVEAGLVISNSETGGGAFSIVPRLRVLVCTNGLTRPMDAVRAVHMGARMDEGVVRWSEDTQRRNLELVTAQTRDAVATFLDVAYMRGVLAELEAKAGVPLANPAEAVQLVGSALKFSDETTAGVLDHFIKAGDATAGGVMQAVTSWAQVVPDAEQALVLEAQAFLALDHAVAVAAR